MSSDRKFTKEEINRDLGSAIKTRAFAGAGKMTELSGDELAAVTGGVGAWAFEFEGNVWSAVCTKSETTNAMLENSLAFKKACKYASPDATTCLECMYLYIGDMGVRVE